MMERSKMVNLMAKVSCNMPKKNFMLEIGNLARDKETVLSISKMDLRFQDLGSKILLTKESTNNLFQYSKEQFNSTKRGRRRASIHSSQVRRANLVTNSE